MRDYSNTIFYKIYCKAPEIKEIYIGHTTDFVKRMQGHKQCCINEKNYSYNTKVYKFIREHGGWDNWQMEIVGYKSCNNLQEACEEEQKYYDKYNATLNSIAPLQVVKNDTDTIKQISNSSELQEKQTAHNNDTPCRFKCEKCNFSCHYKSDYDRHISTNKHLVAISETRNTKSNTNSDYSCVCGKHYKYRTGLSRHKSSCAMKQRSIATRINDDEPTEMMHILKLQQEENNELKTMLLKQQEQYSKQLQELVSKLQK